MFRPQGCGYNRLHNRLVFLEKALSHPPAPSLASVFWVPNLVYCETLVSQTDESDLEAYSCPRGLLLGIVWGKAREKSLGMEKDSNKLETTHKV